MRVTHVITRLIVGGAQENTAWTVLGIGTRPEWQCDLISGPSGGSEGTLEEWFTPHPGMLSIIPELVRPVRPRTDWAALKRLEGTFRRTRPVIVHTHSGKGGVVGRLAAWRAGVPVIIHTIHGPSFGSFQGAVPNFIFRTAERLAARVTTHFISVAEAMTRQYLAVGIGRSEQYTRVFSGFELEPFLQAKNDLALRTRLGLPQDAFVIGKIARYCELKGHEDLFAVAPEVLKAVPNARFLLVGGGPWREKFERELHERGLTGHFVLTGLVPPADVPKLTGVMDVLVHLSRREGLPRAIPQALAAGKPVIAFDCDGAGEVCLPDQTGFLLPPGDRDSLCAKLVELARDASLRARLGTAGRDFVRERFPVKRMIDEIAALYQKLLREAGIPNPRPPPGPAPRSTPSTP